MSAYERIAQLDPFDAANHSKLGRLKMQAGDARTAVARVPRRDCRRVARSGVRAFRSCGKLSGPGRQSAGASRGSRRDRSGARVSARPGAAVEGGRPMIRLRAFAALAAFSRPLMRCRARHAAEERYALIVSGVSGTREVCRQSEGVGLVAAIDAPAAPRIRRRSRHRAFGERLGNSDRQSRERHAHAGVLQVAPDGGRYAAHRAASATEPSTARRRNSILSDRTWIRASGRRRSTGIRRGSCSSTRRARASSSCRRSSGKNRIVIAATDSAAQKYATLFPQYFIEALDQGAKADNDKNGRLSVWEAFTYASQAVKQAFEQKGTLVTERSIIDDNGDGVAKKPRQRRNGRRACQDDVSRSASCVELRQRGARRARKAPHHSRSRDRTAEGEERRDARRASTRKNSSASPSSSPRSPRRSDRLSKFESHREGR